MGSSSTQARRSEPEARQDIIHFDRDLNPISIGDQIYVPEREARLAPGTLLPAFHGEVVQLRIGKMGPIVGCRDLATFGLHTFPANLIVRKQGSTDAFLKHQLMKANLSGDWKAEREYAERIAARAAHRVRRRAERLRAQEKAEENAGIPPAETKENTMAATAPTQKKKTTRTRKPASGKAPKKATEKKATQAKKEKAQKKATSGAIPDEEMIALQVAALQAKPEATKAELMIHFRQKGKSFQNQHFGVLLKKARKLAEKAR